MDLSPSPVTINQPYALTALATTLLATSLALLVLIKNRKSASARMWAAMCLCVAAWSLIFFRSFFSQTPEEALLLLRMANVVSCFIPTLYLHFVTHFLNRPQPRLLAICYIVATAIASTAATPWFIETVTWKFDMWFEVGGPTYLAHAIQFVLVPAYGVCLLIRKARNAPRVKRTLLLYLILASVVGFGGGFMWFPPGLGIDIPPIGGHLVALYCVVITYAILRYRFLDIQLVIRRSLVYSILITLLTIGYFGLVYGLERIFQNTLGYQSPWLSLTAFALMALLFQPLKIGIQRVLDLLIFKAPQEELRRRMERLEEQAKQAEKLKAVATLAAGMAHEIRNPLTALQTFAEFLPEKHTEAEFIQRCHEVFTTETRRIREIVQDVLDFARPKIPQLKPVELGRLIASTVDLLSGELLKRKVKWTVDCQHNLPADGLVAGGATLQADQDQIRQLLINLIQNAADAMPKGGSLSIATRSENGHIKLSISDSGQGIPPELLPKIFDPFVTTKESGNGLGLSVAHSIVRAHRGTIRVDSQPGRGSTFTVRLPL